MCTCQNIAVVCTLFTPQSLRRGPRALVHGANRGRLVSIVGAHQGGGGEEIYKCQFDYLQLQYD
jgi:hypothetical protein